ncbi:MAG: VCBS repeat-containing protein [Verrucomicrobia bacterium]|nr:VCBS repeat-containing protein [Verrucomicrobiota bacterium]
MPVPHALSPLRPGYVRLEGSERQPSATAQLLGPSPAEDAVRISVVVRRRPDGMPTPDFDYFLKTPPRQRQRLSEGDFAARYGAAPDDIALVVKFAQEHGLAVEETHLARRTVTISGTVAQMNNAFAVNLGRYEHEVQDGSRDPVHTEVYRGREGFVHIPAELQDIITGVFGLDNRRVVKRNKADPTNTKPISVDTARQLYRFPGNSAAGQTIAILSEDGYKSSDISQSFGGHPPAIVDINVDASNSGNADPETTQDIFIAGSAAPGAKIAVYFTKFSQAGWIDLLHRVAHPKPGDPVCSVLSSSFYLCNGDDSATLTAEGLSRSFVNAVSAAFQDAAIQGLTVCIASGDTGTASKRTDGKAHVQYPASDPWVLSVGGTTIGNVNGSSYDEYVWNDTFFGGVEGATGGGISDFFAMPKYQLGAGVPVSLNDQHVGRGVPDVAANASPNSGYPLTVDGSSGIGDGTSASAPLWAGYIAVLNAALGVNVGFINPVLYRLGSYVFRDILGSPGPANNGLDGVSGYPATPGWDACTGWGSPNGTALLAALQNLDAIVIRRSGDFDGDGIAELLVTSPWGLGILKETGATMTAIMMAPNGTRFGGWLLNTADNVFGPIADYDGDGRDEILVTSPWGLGILKLSGSTLTAPMMQPNGTRFGGWLLETADNVFSLAADFDGDRRAEVLVTSPWGIGILKLSGSTMAAPMMQPNGTRFGGWLLSTKDNRFGPAADFDGSGHAGLFVTSAWGVGILKLAANTMAAPMMQPNGTRFGGWLLNTGDNHFGPAAADFDGDGKKEILVTSPWGLGILKLSGSTMSAPMMQPNGTRFGGWLLETADNNFSSPADYDGDGQDELLVTSAWGIGILKLSGNTMFAPMMQPNGTRFGGWLFESSQNRLGSAARFAGGRQAEIFITSAWGVGILKLAGSTMAAPMMQPNGTRFGGWLLNTADNVF